MPLGSLGDPAPAPFFTVTTWNVWFDKHHRQERFEALLAQLQSHAPEIMAFQEVTLPFVRAVQEAEWLRQGYWISSTDPNHLGTVLVSRLQPLRLSWVQLPTSMGRRLLKADFPGDLTVAVAHLESLANPELRRQQLAVAFSELKPSARGILLGDFNFGDGQPESEALDSEFIDAWTSHHPKDPGFTRDTLANAMARFGRSEVKRQRLDRILARGLRFEAVDMLGTEPIRDGLYPSDHFGLLARLQM